MIFYTISIISSIDLNDIYNNIKSNCLNVTGIAGNPSWDRAFTAYYDGFMENKFQAYINNEPVFIYELTVTESLGQLGNRLGMYFEAYSLAKRSGLHFIGFEGCFPERNAGIIFKDLIPTIMTHSNPVQSHQEGKENVLKYTFPNQQWSWKYPEASLYHNLEEVISITGNIVKKLRTYDSPEKIYPDSLNITSFDRVQYGNQPSQSILSLPYQPSAVILIRCADLINFGHYDQYGILNFNTYPMIIPLEAEYIYILSEPLKYGKNGQICSMIVDKLVDFLHEKYPSTTIAIRRGYPFDSFAMFAITKYVICAASTFCLWPALTNKYPSQVYFMASKLVAKVKDFPNNFNWISYPKYYGLAIKELIDEKRTDKDEITDKIVQILKELSPRTECCTEQLLYQHTHKLLHPNH